MKYLKLTMVLVLLLSSIGLAQSTLSPEARLKAAMNLELVDRDIPGAIAAYKQIANEFAANHSVAPKALLQLGGIYERTGNPDAQATYQRIINQYPDAGVVFTTARTRLAAIQQAAAGPFKVRELDPWLKGATSISTSPDGKSLAYTRLVDEKSTDPKVALLLREFSNGRERILADFGVGEQEAPFGSLIWSPDSRHLAFAVLRLDAADRRVVTVATKATRLLGAVTIPLAQTFSWSPDSSKLAALTRTHDGKHDVTVYTLVPNGTVSAGEPRVLPPPAGRGDRIVWSPDSQRVAYLTSGPDQSERLRIGRPGSADATEIPLSKPAPQSRTTLIAWVGANDVFFSQSTSGGNDYFLANAGGGLPRRLCEGRGQSGGDGCAAAVSPDGRWQISRQNVSGGGKIVMRNLVDGSERALTREAVVETFVAFSPDSKLVAFKSNRDATNGIYVVPIDAAPVARPVKIASLDGEGAGATATWTPERLVMRVTNNQTGVYRVDVNASSGKVLASPIRLTEDSPAASSPQVSPDGKRIAYISRSRPSGFAVMNANGTNERVFKEVPLDVLSRMTLIGWLTENEVLTTDPGLGPGAVRTLPKKLTAINVTTGGSRSAGADVEGAGHQLVGGGSVLFHIPGSVNGGFHIRPLAGGEPTRAAAIREWWVRAASGDGRWLAYSTLDDSPGRGKPWPGDIRLRSLESGTERVLLKFADTKESTHAPLDLSSNGKFLVYQDPNFKLMVANCETGESWPLLTNPPADVDFEWPMVRWSPDGTFIAITGTTSRTTYRAYEGITHDAVTKVTTTKK